MLRLRPYKACDANTIVTWIRDEASFRKWCADRFPHYPMTADDMNAHYDDVAYSDDFYEWTAFDETGVVGHLITRFTDQDKKVLRFGFVIVDDTKRGQGYGKQMLQLALQYAFDILRVDKVTLGVFANNESAYRCYRAAGFDCGNQEEAEQAICENRGKDSTEKDAWKSWKCLELETRRKVEE